MSKFFLVLILLGLFYQSLLTYAHVPSKTSSGVSIRWPTNTPNISLNVDEAGLQDLTSMQLSTVLSQSTSQFQAYTGVQITAVAGADAPNVSSLSFTNEPYFSAGILAVTNVSYNATTGYIKEADILVNENYSFTHSALATPGNYFLGDVLTHEMGHMLGLSHSEVHDSSMIYTVFRGQWSLANEDINGLNHIYSVSGLGKITGKIIGGVNLVPVFGAKVEAISTKLGKVAGNTISGEDGSFSIGGLPLNDTYYIYTAPLKSTTSIPSYYSSAINNVCSGASYRGSFFTKCGDDALEKPQAIHLSNLANSVDVGKISIRCNFNLGIDYLDQKSSVIRDERVLFDFHEETGGSLSGLFFAYEKLGPLVTTYGDEYVVDLTTVSSPNGKNLELNFISQSLNSALAVSIYVTRAEGINPVQFDTVYNSASPVYTTDIVENLNRSVSIPLSSVSGENIFSIRLVPVLAFNQTQLESIFASPSTFVDNLSPYLLTASVSQGGSYISMADHAPYQDNSSCPEKTTTSETKPFITNKDATETGQRRAVAAQSGMACGTVDFDGDNNGGDGPSGPVTMALGFISMLLIMKSMKKSLIKLKKSWNVQRE